MTGVIETGYELYNEIQRRGLHVRHEYGRDNAVLLELRERLGCPDDRLAVFLKERHTSAQDFLKAFLSVAAPFARMFEEIWAFLASHVAPRASETIRVRFGWDTDGIDIDLDQFRVAVESTRLIRTSAIQDIWPRDAVGDLFDLQRVISPQWREPVRSWPDYRYMEPYTLLDCRTGRDDEFERLVGEIHRLFQAMADADAEWSARDRERQRSLAELDIERGQDRARERPATAGLLSDLLPGWRPIFDDSAQVPSNVRRAAVAFLETRIRPKIAQQAATVVARARELLDILELPFWRHRWHTYEIWATMLVLRSLDPLRPRPLVSNGHLRLDVTETSRIADLLAQDHPDACVVTQMETPFHHMKRRAIRPDISICFDDKRKAESRALVVEVKHRQALTRAHVAEVGGAYRSGSPRASGVVLVNYDRAEIGEEVPADVVVLQDIRPDMADQVRAASELILQWTANAGLRPRYQAVMVLLDVSGSMRDQYEPPEVQRALRKMLAMPGLKIYRFNDGLVPGGDWDASPHSLRPSLATGGGTSLRRAMQQLYFQKLAEVDRRGVDDAPLAMEPFVEVVLVVSDGGYETNVPELGSVPLRKRVLPSELEQGLEWLSHPDSREFAALGTDPISGTGL